MLQLAWLSDIVAGASPRRCCRKDVGTSRGGYNFVRAPGHRRRGASRVGGEMTESHVDPDATIESIGEFGLIDRLARIVTGPDRDPRRPAATGPIGNRDDPPPW